MWEWMRSLWGPNPTEPAFRYPYHVDDVGEDLDAPEGVLRAVRGGSFDLHRVGARCACRSGIDPVYRDWDGGFRVVVSPIS